jgi:AraC family transcriptional regulator
MCINGSGARGVEGDMTVVDIATGTAQATCRTTGRYVVSDIAFAGGARLPWHAHPHSLVAVVVGGGVQKTYTRTTQEARRATLIAMPAEERHADRFAADGARMVVVESEDDLPSVAAFDSWTAAGVAHRIRQELARPDAFSDLALESLALELAVLAGRAAPSVDRAPRWLLDVLAILCEHTCDPPSARQLANEIGIHPAHLARSFRAATGESVGSYARNVRLDWAARRLVGSDDPLARVACEAGFADQSHFTRAFSRRFGVAPGRYRRVHR